MLDKYGNALLTVVNLVRNYFNQTSIHGLRFISQPGRHWTERLLWSALCAFSWIGSGILIFTSWDAFQNNAVSFVVETAYLQANTSFPSVSVCEEENLPPLYEAANQLFGENHDCNLDEVLRELTYFKGSAYYMKEFCSTEELGCPTGNYLELVEKVRGTCETILMKCSWQGKPFDCCKHFVIKETELGPCFTFGNLNERKLRDQGQPDWIDTVGNRHVPLPSLRFEINGTVKVYLHSEADVPNLNTLTADILQPAVDLIKIFQISVIDIENPPEVKKLSIKQRKCRFSYENNLKSADYYSYSACVVDCRRMAQLEMCNCTSHFMPKSRPEEHCNLEGVLCLNNHYSELSVQKTKWGEKEGLVCDCLPGCSDPEYNIISTSSASIPESNLSIVEVNLDRYPTERYKRNVVRGSLDLVVSMGSAAGLFVGASLLSFVEIFYFFLFRSYSEEELKGTKAKTKVAATVNYRNRMGNVRDWRALRPSYRALPTIQ